MFNGKIAYNVVEHLTEEILHEAVSSHLLGSMQDKENFSEEMLYNLTGKWYQMQR